MSIELTFKDVCKTIKKQGKDDPKLIEAVDNLLGLAFICSPAVLGPAAAALLPILAVKNELVKIGKSVFDKVTGKNDEDYLQRYETMHTAYGLLVFTSFFDALDACLPKALRKEIGLLEPGKAFIAKEALKKSPASKHIDHTCEVHDASISDTPIVFPHPTETLTEQCKRQAKLWQQMSQGVVEFVQYLPFWKNADEDKQAVLLKGLEKLEDETAKRFEAQYFELTRKYEDFAIWANLQAHKGTKALIGSLSEYMKQYAKLSAASENKIDVGFTSLRQLVDSIPETLRVEQATEIADSLNKHYQHRINDPIIEDKEVGDEEGPRLSFPKIRSAFIPQAFKVLRQAGKSRRLEEETTWNSLPKRSDLGTFFLSYLTSPYSTDTPLLILGHPGSGKSLLTTILSAQLMSKQFTAIRVPLREVNADADIPEQIEEFIKRISGVSFDSWVKLRTQFKNCPPVVILDGYDELLQASGQVFASYIKDAQKFQQHQTEQGWPVRIIITSRVTLIDKAAIPLGSTIVRLLEFDEGQRKRWSDIWNKANAAYFRDANIEKFSLPATTESGAEKILSLAEQPLLLLMLALYDSEGNQLRTSQGLDRTKLYDSLLRRFVVRERGKDKGFNDEETKKRETALTKEMQRLGVAALGMYNRRKVHILSAELDDDLAFFNLEREVELKPGKALSQADLLLGSFFFVHKSKAQHSSGAEDTHEESSAFEFLHNTFGEFLTADFIVRRVVEQVKALLYAESDEAGAPQVETMLRTADGMQANLMASLLYTPLFTRPVILDMVKEWVPHVIAERKLDSSDLTKALEKVVLSQLRRLLSDQEMPQLMRQKSTPDGRRVPFGDHPLLGHIAIYSINLVLLRLVSGKVPFIFNESEIASYEDGTRPWDRLMHIWRSWFSLENLNGLTAVMVSDRTGNEIEVKAKDKFQAEERKGKLQEFYNVALSLGDDVSACVAGYYLFDPTEGSRETLDKLQNMTNSEGLDLGIPAMLAELQVLARSVDESPGAFVKHSRRVLEQAIRIGRRDQIESTCQVIARTLEQTSLYRYRGKAHGREFYDIIGPNMMVELAIRDPRSARVLIGLGKRFHEPKWLFEFSRGLLDYFSHKMPLFEIGAPSSRVGDSFELLQLVKEVGGSGGVFRYARKRDLHPKYFERMLEPHQLLELCERNPEGALSYLKILRELGGKHLFEEFLNHRMGSEFIDRMFDPRHLLELSEYNPEVALAYLQILREWGGGRLFEEFLNHRMGSEFIDRMFDPSRLLELSERNPEGALSYLKILRELGGGRLFEEYFSHRMGSKFIDRMFDPRHLLELSEYNPKVALVYLQILREFKGGNLFEEYFSHRMGSEFMDRMFNPRHLMELSERNPKAVLEYLQILRELVGKRHSLEEYFSHRMEPEFIDHMLNIQRTKYLQMEKVESLGVWLAFARLFNSESVLSELEKIIMDMLRFQPLFKARISSLPITSLSDLRWLAKQSKSIELRSLVDELMA